jgi:hypothetical protein
MDLYAMLFNSNEHYLLIPPYDVKEMEVWFSFNFPHVPMYSR